MAVRRPRLEVADVFHHHGAAWRQADARHVSLGQLQVMSAIEQCRSAALGGHVERCEVVVMRLCLDLRRSPGGVNRSEGIVEAVYGALPV